MNKNVACKSVVGCTNIREIKMTGAYLQLCDNLENKDGKTQPSLEATGE